MPRSLTTDAHPGPVRFCRFSPHGCLFASTSCDCTIRLWDVAEAKCLQALHGEWAGWDWEPSSQAWVPFRTLLCPVPPRPCLAAWPVPAGHQRSVETISFSPDAKQLASGGWDKRVMLWEVQPVRPGIQGCTPSTAATPSNWERLFHLSHTWHPIPLHLAAATSPGPLPPPSCLKTSATRFPLPVLPSSPAKAREASRNPYAASHYPGSPTRRAWV